MSLWYTVLDGIKYGSYDITQAILWVMVYATGIIFSMVACDRIVCWQGYYYLTRMTYGRFWRRLCTQSVVINGFCALICFAIYIACGGLLLRGLMGVGFRIINASCVTICLLVIYVYFGKTIAYVALLVGISAGAISMLQGHKWSVGWLFNWSMTSLIDVVTERQVFVTIVIQLGIMIGIVLLGGKIVSWHLEHRNVITS